MVRSPNPDIQQSARKRSWVSTRIAVGIHEGRTPDETGTSVFPTRQNEQLDIVYLYVYTTMKHRDLKRQLKKMGWWDTGKGTKHEKWSNGTHSVAVPRHKEISEGTAKAILKEAELYGGQSEKLK